MSSPFQNQILVNVGSLVTANGLILLAAPGRFAVLRTNAWAPQTFNQGVGGLGSNRRLGRSVGAVAAAIGIAMVAYGLLHTDPTD